MDSGSLPCIGDGDQNCPEEKEMQEGKVKSLQIAEKRGEAKSKGERERYTQLNAEFQRIARRDKQAFLNEQCKEIRESKGLRITRDLFNKIRDMNGTFHAKIKDRNNKNLTEADEIKNRWQRRRTVRDSS